jgi:hypothetical protein
MEGGVSNEKDERGFSEGSDVAEVAWLSLRWDCVGWDGMIASLSSGRGVVQGDCRFVLLLMEKMEMTQLVDPMSASMYIR